ncbi:TPA: hypothetical protein EYP37_07925, partial [Candidatus Poribacteria bacterium]|nr:hypothetical protein [Candidatus Poribacteria bacterium]
MGEAYTIRTRLGYREVWEFITRVRSSSRVEIVFIDEEIEKAKAAIKEMKIEGEIIVADNGSE